ncbi:DUF4357 domain-containing protein [Blastopirellula marina]|uniref:DUF4357 domain-containing protein n=1 Tax=Blastopirellula marina TaxID=124 RepID=A0A2S8F9V9_9BACT|nr:DUF4357 domain-containing protein [Blastopirellula marina]PQO28922.1 hypothetical protein C5Y98_24490 [Blastopirellula marina]PTL42195.1 hypothetical protein C5Y97_24505 [Blastopirellula marina]
MQTNNGQVFTISSSDATAKGQVKVQGFLVLEGSIARLHISPSGVNRIQPRRDQLMKEGVVEKHADGLKFTRDYLFDSPSGAASFVLGQQSIGWTEWKTPQGETLSQVMRLARDEDAPILSESQQAAILEKHELLLADGKLPTTEELEQSYTLFRERFAA